MYQVLISFCFYRYRIELDYDIGIVSNSIPISVSYRTQFRYRYPNSDTECCCYIRFCAALGLPKLCLSWPSRACAEPQAGVIPPRRSPPVYFWYKMIRASQLISSYVILACLVLHMSYYRVLCCVVLSYLLILSCFSFFSYFIMSSIMIPSFSYPI